MEPLAYRPKGYKMLPVALAGIAAGLLTLSMMFSLIGGQIHQSWHQPGAWIFGFVAIVGPPFFLGGGCFLLYQTIARKPTIIVSEKGWTTTGPGAVTIPWECIETIGIYRIETPTLFGSNKTSFLGVVPKRLDRLLELVDPRKQRSIQRQFDERGMVALVADVRLPMTCEQVLDEVLPYMRKLNSKTYGKLTSLLMSD